MKQEYLKIKIMSLGAEARIDRARERKLLDRARRLKFMLSGPDGVGPYDHMKEPTAQQQKWRQRAATAKAKMEAERALAISLECNTAYNTFFGVRLHRIHVVKHICRHAHLAYGFLRGMPYSWMEQSCHTRPNWGWQDEADKPSNSVLATALRFSGKMDSRDVRQKLEAWCQEADEHIKLQERLKAEWRAQLEAERKAQEAEENPVQEPASAA